MGATFYGVLGVGPDADAEAIRRAYRERVVDVHPDVCERPDATDRFRRLTTAKETLVDDAERARYDRLGHDPYVREFGEPSLWEVTGSAGPARGGDERPRNGGRQPGPSNGVSEDSSSERSANSGAGRRHDGAATASTRGERSAAKRSGDATARRNRRRSGGNRSTGRYGRSSFWESATPGRRVVDGPRRDPVLRRVSSALRRLGPWVVVHLVFLSLAVGTAWYVGTVLASGPSPSGPLLAALVGELALALSISTVHVLAHLSR